MKNRKTLNVDSNKFKLLIERMDKKYTYEESINKIRSLIVEGPGKRFGEIIRSGGDLRIDTPNSLKNLDNIFDINKTINFSEVDNVLKRGFDGVKEDFVKIGKRLSPVDELALKNLFSYLDGIKNAKAGVGDAILNINTNLKSNTNLDLNQRIEFIDEVYKDNPSLLDDAYPGRTELNKTKNKNGEFNSRDAIDSRIKSNFLSLDVDDIKFLYKNSTYRLGLNPKKLFAKLNLRAGDVIVWKSSWGKGNYYIIPFDDANPQLIKNLEGAGYKTYTENKYAGIEDSLPTGGGVDPNKPIKVITPGKSKLLSLLLGNRKGGGWGGIWVRTAKGKAVFPSYIFMTFAKLAILTIECAVQNQKIKRLVDGEEVEYTYSFMDCAFGGTYQTKDGLESYKPWFYAWHGYNVFIPSTLQLLLGTVGEVFKFVVKDRVLNRFNEYENRVKNFLINAFKDLSIRETITFDPTEEINNSMADLLKDENAQSYLNILSWVTGADFDNEDVKDFILNTLEGISEAELQTQEQLDKIRKKMEEEFGRVIVINNEVSKEGDSLDKIQIENIRQKLINQSKLVKGKAINEKIDNQKKIIDLEAEEKKKLCIDMETQLDLYSDKGWKEGDSRENLTDANCEDSKNKLLDITSVMKAYKATGFEGLEKFATDLKCNIGLLKESYKTTCIDTEGFQTIEVTDEDDNQKGKVRVIKIPLAEYSFQKVVDTEEKDSSGNPIYKIVASFTPFDLTRDLMALSGSIIKDPDKGIGFLNKNGVEYKVGWKDSPNRGKFCPKLTEKNIRTLETYGEGGFCSNSTDKSKCINALIETINNDEIALSKMDTWNGCEYGWDKPE